MSELERAEDELTELAEVLGRAMNQDLVVASLHYRPKLYHQTKGKVGTLGPSQSIILDQGAAIPV